MDKHIQSLINIGFKEMEAEIYLILLKESGISAYKISKILKKPKATVYKALEIMQEKGMVYSNEVSKAVEYFPTDIKEFLDWKEREFTRNRKIAEDQLKDIGSINTNTGIFALENIEQMFNKAQKIISSSEKSIIICAVQLKRQSIINEIKKAIERNVKVMIHTFLPKIDIPGADIIAFGDSQKLYENHQFDWMEIFSDGKEFLLSLLDWEHKKIYKSIWSNDPYVSVIFYNANVGEFINCKTLYELHDGIDSQEILENIKKLRSKYYIGVDMNSIKHLLNT